jgi:hypothetical protein
LARTPEPTNDTVKDGVLDNWYRVKYTTTGTYAGTTIQIDIATRNRVQ